MRRLHGPLPVEETNPGWSTWRRWQRTRCRLALSANVSWGRLWALGKGDAPYGCLGPQNYPLLVRGANGERRQARLDLTKEELVFVTIATGRFKVIVDEQDDWTAGPEFLSKEGTQARGKGLIGPGTPLTKMAGPNTACQRGWRTRLGGKISNKPRAATRTSRCRCRCTIPSVPQAEETFTFPSIKAPMPTHSIRLDGLDPAAGYAGSPLPPFLQQGGGSGRTGSMGLPLDVWAFPSYGIGSLGTYLSTQGR